MSKKYYIVADQNGLVFGGGLSKQAARKDAFHWHKDNGPAELPFKPAIRCSKEASNKLCYLSDAVDIEGVLHTKYEVRNNKLAQAMNKKKNMSKKKKAKMTQHEFEQLSTSDKLNVLFSLLKGK